MPLDEQRALNQLGSSSGFEGAVANTSRRRNAVPSASTSQTRVAPSNAASSSSSTSGGDGSSSTPAPALPVLPTAQHRCLSSDVNGPPFFTKKPGVYDFPSLTDELLASAVQTAVQLWNAYLKTPEAKAIGKKRSVRVRPPTDVDSARRGKQRREDPNQQQVDRGVRTSCLHAIHSVVAPRPTVSHAALAHCT